MDDPRTLSPKRKVSVLWALLLGFFLVFNAVYFPVRQYQAQRAPENFEAHAARLLEGGYADLAQKHLAAGIDWFHPAYPSPYEKLGAMGDPRLDLSRRLYGHLQSGRLDGVALEDLAQAHAPLAIAGPTLEDAVSLWREEGLLSPRDVAVTGEAAAALVLAGQGVLSPVRIGETGVPAPVGIVAASGPRAVLVIDGVDYGGRARGFYAAVLDAATGRILQLGQFDLWESWDESERMAKFLQRAPLGSIGVFAVSQEASVYFDNTHLAPELEYFGLTREAMVQRRMRFYGMKYRFAAIGVKGAQGGIQAWSPGEFNGSPGHPVCVATWPENE